jgi:hypothetical protein
LGGNAPIRIGAPRMQPLLNETANDVGGGDVELPN